MRKVIIGLAPVEAGATVDYETLPEDIIQSIDLGASICHLHSRNKEGNMIADPSKMLNCFEQVLTKREVIVQASTGGVSDLTIKERCAPLASDIVESCSLNGGSTNLGEYVYKNSFEEIRYVEKHAYEKRIFPEIEVFDIGMIQAVEKISETTPFQTPKLYNLVFGHPGGMQATVENLIAFRSFVPSNCLWGVTHFGRANWDFLACAIAMGATDVRVGFEDSRIIAGTKNATKNYELVERLSQLIQAIGYSVATVKEAKEILSIRKDGLNESES